MSLKFKYVNLFHVFLVQLCLFLMEKTKKEFSHFFGTFPITLFPHSFVLCVPR